MPQNVPSFEFSDRAKEVRKVVFEHWCEHGVGPTLRDVREATGFTRRQIAGAYKELQLGIVVVVEIGLISPPVGMNLFVLNALLPQVPTKTLFRGVLPFVIADVVRLAILIAFPIISLWLPSLMR